MKQPMVIEEDEDYLDVHDTDEDADDEDEV